MKQNKIPRNEYIIKPKGKTNPYKHDVVYTNLGQWKYPGQVTRIPGDAFGTHITMKGINEPLYARDDQGNEQMMQPGEEYQFPGQYVTEYPQIAKNGGGLLNKTLTCPKCGWSWKAVDGGKDIATCHKCGGTAKLAYGGLHKAQKGEQVEDNDSWLENIAEIVDPTGISSWDDMYRAYKNSGVGKELALEALGAIPFLGKVSKVTKPGIHLTKYSGIDQILKNTLPRNKSLSRAANVASKTGRGTDAVQAVLGAKDDSGFTWDLRHGEVPKYGGRNIFPQIDLGEHGDFAYGGDPSLPNIEGHYQDGGAKTPEEWEKQIRAVEKKIGNPSTWTLDSYKILQDKLNEYKTWRENTPEGKAVIDYHNEPNEYIIPLPSHLQTVPKKPFGGIHTKTNTHMAKGGWLDSYQDGGKKIDMSKVKMDYYPKSNVEAQSRLDEEKAWENDYYRQQDKDYQNEVNAAVKKGIPRKQAELVIKRYKTDRYQATEQPVLSQGKKLNPSEQAYSDKVKARISNPSNDLGITAANMASALTRFRYLNPEEIAATTNNPSATAGLSSNIMTEALANEMAGPAFGKVFSSGAKNLTKKKLEKQAINNFQPQHLDVPPPPSYEQYAASNLDPVSRENYQATFNITPETRRLINSIDWGNYSLISDRLPNINNFSSSLDDLFTRSSLIKNRSGLTKKQALEKFAGKDKEALSKMSEKEFQETVIKPTGEVVKYKPGPEVNQMGYNADLRDMQLKNAIPMSHEEYSNAFNERLDLLNDIIAKNNKSGVEYKVKGLDPGGNLIFETPSMPGADQRWLTTINPGQWRGKVEDIANSEYYKSIPGLDMRNTSSSVFGDRQPRRGSGAYESINEYLKGLDLGRVKPGFNSQTNSSQGLWENSIKKGNAFGFYSNPQLVHGAMKSALPYVGTGALGAAALQQEKFGGFLDAYDEGGNNPATSPTVAAIAANAKALKEEKDFDLIDSYLQEKRRVEGVRTRAAEIAANKAKSTNPSTRTNLSYIKNGAYYCNTHTGECFQDAGATTPTGKKVPVIPGNLQWDSEMKKLGFDWADTPQPGDIAREQLYKTSDYQGNPLSPGWYTSHSGVVTKGGKDLMIGNAPGGARNSYVNQPVDKMTGGRDPKTVHMKYQRYVGNLPGMQQDYDTIMKNLYSESIPSITPSYDFTAPLEERDIMPQSNLKYGGWLDDEQFRRGGQKGLKSFTSKNVYTSVNDIMLRNETLFGPAGKKRYKPSLNYKDGGWLDNMY